MQYIIQKNGRYHTQVKSSDESVKLCIINVKFYSFLYQSTYIVKCFYKYFPNSCFHISSSRSSENAAFAGLVDGSSIIGRTICSA